MAATACVKAGAWVTTSATCRGRRGPEWMSEKAIAIGHYFVTSGFTLCSRHFPTTGSDILSDYLFKGIEETYGGKWISWSNPKKWPRR